MLTPATGFDLDVSTGAAPKVPHIAFSLQKALVTALGDEGYQLDVTPKGVAIRASATITFVQNIAGTSQATPLTALSRKSAGGGAV